MTCYSIGFLVLILLVSHCNNYVKGATYLRDQREQYEVNSVDGETHADVTDESIKHVFRESIAGLSSRNDLIKKHRVESTVIHEVIFHIQQNNVDEIERILHEVSDPTNVKYGQHLSREEVAAITSNPVSHDYVVAYLDAAGVTILAETLSGEYITTSAPVSVWEELLDTQFFEFHHIKDEEYGIEKFIRATTYSVPILLDKHVTSAFNTIQMPLSIWAKPIVTALSDTDLNKIHANAAFGFIEPSVLKSFYNINDAVGNSRSTQAAFETIGQYFSPADLKAFQIQFSLPQQSIAADIGSHSSDALCISTPSSCVEANLDIQYIMAISQNSPTTNWYSNSNSFASWLVTVANVANPPRVLSISYGADESDVSKSEFDAFNLQAIKLGVMGVTIIASSGDDGVSSYTARNDRNRCGYMPLFPASSPYVIAVGGTQGVEAHSPEITCQSNFGGGITSGGGFSTYYPQPAWQSELVARYLSSVTGNSKTPAPGYNSRGRGYPDVSLAAAHYLTYVGGRQYAISGTSAATPVMAGMISLVNAARLAAGKSSLGWMNQAIYRSYQYYSNDITIGKNNCAAGVYSPVCCAQGFNAAVGWDPATGLGSVNFAPFMNFFLNYDNAAVHVPPPTMRPTPRTAQATPQPIDIPTTQPTVTCTTQPADVCTSQPTNPSTSQPTDLSTAQPSSIPAPLPTSKPTRAPISVVAPTFRPCHRPTRTPTAAPVRSPFTISITLPTSQPTNILTDQPTNTRTTPKTKGKSRNKFGKNSKAKGGDNDNGCVTQAKNSKAKGGNTKGKNSGDPKGNAKDSGKDAGKGKGGDQGKGKGKGKRT